MMTEAWIPENIPPTWQVCPISDLCNVVRGGSPRPMGDPRYFGGNIPFIKISDVTRSDGRHVYESETTVNEAGSKRSRLVTKGSLILSNSGTVCVPIFLGVKACIHDGFVAFDQLPESINQDYLYYFFKYIRPYILNKHKQGVTQVNLNTQIVGEIAFIFPPPAEQKRIVAKIEELFSELDKGLENLKAAREQLKIYRQAVLKHAFEGKLTANWRRQFGRTIEKSEDTVRRVHTPPRPSRWKTRSRDLIIGHSALTVNNPKSSLPDGWAWVQLVDIARMESGHTPSRRHPEWWNGDVKWIGIADARLHHGQTINQTLQHTNEDGLSNSAARLLPRGTVCVSRTASVGYVVTMGDEMATVRRQDILDTEHKKLRCVSGSFG